MVLSLQILCIACTFDHVPIGPTPGSKWANTDTHPSSLHKSQLGVICAEMRASVMHYLNRQTQPCTARTMSRALHCMMADVNRELYAGEREGLYRKTDRMDAAPVWTLREEEEMKGEECAILLENILLLEKHLQNMKAAFPDETEMKRCMREIHRIAGKYQGE